MSEESDSKRRLRFRFQWRQVGLLVLVWLAMVGEVNVITVVGGFLIAWGVTIFFPLPPVHYYGRFHFIGMIKLVVALVRDLAAASFKLSVYAFTARPVRSGVIRVNLRSRSDLYQVNVAELASVVPGTIVVDARRRTRALYLHVFNLPNEAARRKVIEDTLAIEHRVLHAFGSTSEIAALERQEEESA